MTVHLLYYKIVHHFTLLVGNFCLQPGTKMLRHSTGKPDFFLLNITPNHSQTDPPPSYLPVLKVVPPKFKAWSRKFEKWGRGGGGSQALLGPKDAL